MDAARSASRTASASRRINISNQMTSERRSKLAVFHTLQATQRGENEEATHVL